MSELELVINKLNGLENRLDNIETAISLIAVQDEKILNMQSQISAIWKKIDMMTGPDGTISNIKNHQARCPENRVTNLENRFWGILISIGLIYLSGLGGIMIFVLKH